MAASFFVAVGNDSNDILFQKEENMTELRYPNESREYREAREALLKDEQELVKRTTLGIIFA